jgi:hypothetical protein
MVVKIRLARFGRRKTPFYNIVVAHARFVNLFIWIGECTDGCRTARNSKPIEVIGMPRIPAQHLCRRISAKMGLCQGHMTLFQNLRRMERASHLKT